MVSIDSDVESNINLRAVPQFSAMLFSGPIGDMASWMAGPVGNSRLVREFFAKLVG
jgi:hypothetical protein